MRNENVHSLWAKLEAEIETSSTPWYMMGRRKKSERSSMDLVFSKSSSSSSNFSTILVNIIVLWSCMSWMLCTSAAAAALIGTLQSDAQALQRFREAVDPTGMLLNSWVNDSEVCTGSWMGVECYQGRVFSLKLPLSGLFGIIPNDTLGQVTELRVVSLHNNFLTGPFPGELGNCGNLRALYLATNSFFGPLPSLAGFWPRLTHLSLGFNNFSGSIPDSISFFPELYLLDLQNNSFSGAIPPLNLSTLRKLTLQNNNLSGTVPSSLQSFPAADFAGNPDLCGPPTTATCPVATTPAASPVSAPAPSGSSAAPPHRGKRKLAAAYIAAIVVGGSIFLILLATGILFCCWWCWRRAVAAAAGSGDQKSSSKGEKSSGEKSPDQEQKDDNSSSAQGDQPGGRGSNKLVFFEEAGKRYSFDLEDLLRASAEVLGKGSLGTAYKAVLEDGTIVAVKRLKDVTTPRREFEAQLATVGRLQHPNVVPLRAYYFSKEEKLLVYEYYSNGSLSSYLHGRRFFFSCCSLASYSSSSFPALHFCCNKAALGLAASCSFFPIANLAATLQIHKQFLNPIRTHK
jgi:hypothetical protein